MNPPLWFLLGSLLVLAVAVPLALPWWRRRQDQRRQEEQGGPDGWWVPATHDDCQGKDLADPTGSAAETAGADSGAAGGDGGSSGGGD